MRKDLQGAQLLTILCLGLVKLLLNFCCGSYVVTRLSNTAAHVGESVRLNCSVVVEEYDFVEWRRGDFTVWFTALPRINKPSYPDRYQIKSYGDYNPKHFDLIILSVVEEDAGNYSCSIYKLINGGTLEPTAQLIVLTNFMCEANSKDEGQKRTAHGERPLNHMLIHRRDPNLKELPKSPAMLTSGGIGKRSVYRYSGISQPRTIVENNTVQFVCTVRVIGDFLPVLEWRHTNYTIPTMSTVTFYHTENQTVQATSFLKAKADYDGLPFECRLFFHNSKSSENNTDIQMPTYTNSCITRIEVFYPPHDIIFIPSAENGVLYIGVGETVTCSSRANPEPSYIWTNITDITNIPNDQVADYIITGSKLLIDMSFISDDPVLWICHASTIIEGRLYWIQSQILLDVSEGARTSLLLKGKVGGGFDIVITMGMVGVTVFVIAAISLCAYMKGRQREKAAQERKNFLDMMGNTPQTAETPIQTPIHSPRSRSDAPTSQPKRRSPLIMMQSNTELNISMGKVDNCSG